ncbi:MAG: SIMPL domain-containing protein [Planctomycetaceae bacterium]|nr:SIMPL domain-containing protein [Planctomycetaceae bacterium]
MPQISRKSTLLALLSQFSYLLMPTLAVAQGYGGAGGYGGGASGEGNSAAHWNPQLMRPANYTSYNDTPVFSKEAAHQMTYSGTAEVRVVPEEIRLVMAVTSEGASGSECRQLSQEKITAVKQAWAKLGIAEQEIVVDFISVLPRYEWLAQENGARGSYIQQLAGYRLQENLHISVANEEAAMQAIYAAMNVGVSDVVTFDYWSSQLGAQLKVARQQALKAAQEKAELLLTAFDKPPALINVSEESGTFFPHQLYTTYENILEQDGHDRGNNTAWIKAYRPKMTFLDGLKSQSDVRPAKALLTPEIIVVSTVTLTYNSPAADQE